MRRDEGFEHRLPADRRATEPARGARVAQLLGRLDKRAERGADARSTVSGSSPKPSSRSAVTGTSTAAAIAAACAIASSRVT